MEIPNRKCTLSEKSVHVYIQVCAHTYLATCALVIEGAKSDGGEEDGNVEEDGGGHVLQQGFITANYT